MAADFTVPLNARRKPDAIVASKLRFQLDKRGLKIDVGIGEYRDDYGKVWTPKVVVKTWRDIVNEYPRVSYLGPKDAYEFVGDNVFLYETSKLLFGKKKALTLLQEGRLSAIGTTGGTQAVSLFLEFLKATCEDPFVLLGIPSWPIHLQILDKYHIQTKTYDHLSGNKYNFETHLEEIKKAPRDSLILMHGGLTHNPTGVNPDSGQWDKIMRAAAGKRIFFDAPYIGFDKTVKSDTKAIRKFTEKGFPVAVGVSFAKNTGLYNERPAALFIVSTKPHSSIEVQRVLNNLARSNYSTPPASGERIIGRVLSDPSLSLLWEKELEIQAKSLEQRRSAFSSFLPGFSFVKKQKGLFSILPLSEEKTAILEDKYAVYMPSTKFGARINFGGVNSKNIEALAERIKKVI